jgi:cytochrome P450
MTSKVSALHIRPATVQRRCGQAHAVDRDTRTDGQAFAEPRRKGEPEAAQPRPVDQLGHGRHALNDAGEHGAALCMRKLLATMQPSITSFSLAAPPPGFIDDPYPFYDALREHEPVHRLAADSVLLTRYADVLAVYRNPAASSDKRREFAAKLQAPSPIYQHHTTSLVFNDPPLHTRVRRTLMGALNQRAIARMEPGMVALADRLLDQLPEQTAPDLIEHFAALIPVEVIGNLLAVPRERRGPLRAWSLAILSALEPAPGEVVLAAANSAVEQFLDLLRELVAERRARPGDPEVDVLTRLLQGAGDRGSDGALSESELLHNCIFLLNAGHETTTNLIGNGMHTLLQHPDQQQRLVKEPHLLNGAIEEMLRYESPLQLNNRLTTAPLAISDGELPAGCFVTLAIGAANRDPAVFEQPHRFHIARKPNNHLAFGQAAHACSGMNVARLEARIAIDRLLARFPHVCADGEALRDRRVRFRGLCRLPVKLN